VTGREGAGVRESDALNLDPKTAAGVRDVAVIDVGSNSVRLVVYRIEGRDFTPLLNDRAAAGIGRDLARTGALYAPGAEAALAAIRRFRLFLDARHVRDVRVVGTAAVREASDAKPFIAAVEQAIGVKVRVLSGEQEGRYAGLGVLAGDPRARGIVADLGGSSLELAPIEDGQVRMPVTLLLGAFVLTTRANGDVKVARTLLDDALDGISIAMPERGALYVVGGAWRNFGKIAMALRDYPLKFLQGYEIAAEEASDIARFLAKQSPASISRMSEISRRRAEAMPFAATALERLIKRLGARSVVISSSGLREGILLESLPARVRAADPLLAGIEAMARRAGAELAFGRKLEGWIAPLTEAFGAPFEPERRKRLFVAACRLGDVGGALHPDHRYELAAHRVLYAQFSGASHAERVFLSRVVHHRYAGRKEPEQDIALDRILTPEARDAALRLGLTIRLAGSISSRASSLLSESRLELTAKELRLRLTSKGSVLATEIVEKRLAQLAEALGRQAVIETR
jgi:exopolyphosphatase/guanosine-5'-triphosphate,3'-diphosphate pyrophosphatase